MATPAQIANDMAARALLLRGRESAIADVCRDAARLIRQFLAGEAVDGRTVAGVIRRLNSFRDHRLRSDVANALSRALDAIETLQQEARK